MRKTNSFSSLLHKELEERPCYISHNILPKTGTLIYGGHSKIGKSFLMLNMARNLILGESLWGCSFVECEKCSVLLVEQEIGEHGLQERGSKIFHGIDGKDLSNFNYITKSPNLQINTDKGFDLLTAEIAELKPNVLMLDPIGKLHTCDENSASEIGDLFNRFEKLKKINPEKQMSVVFSHHFKKPGMGQYVADPLDPHNFRGSIRWFSDPDTIITFAKKETYQDAHKWWTVRTRFELRQGESPDDMMMSINENLLDGSLNDGDNRVNYMYSVDDDNQVIRNKTKEKKKKKEREPEQMVFRP